MTQQRSSREFVKTALCKVILDFQKWLHADTKALQAWKDDSKPIVIVEGRLVDDVQSMVDSYRKSGAARLPRLFLAVQRIKEKPDASSLRTVPNEINSRITGDQLKRNIKFRAIARAFRIQFAFLVNDPDSASSFTDQFSNYIELAEKRRFPVTYVFDDNASDDWHLTILDNSIFPDSASIEETDLTIGIFDFVAQGLLPQITAGLNPDEPAPWSVVVEADMYPDRPTPEYLRLKADKDTGERSSEVITKGGLQP
jgi:hypothetical protein